MATPAEPRPNKRVLALVKAFLKAGIMTESGQVEDTDTGTPQGVILSPQLANIALSVLEPMGLRLSQAKTQIVQMQDGFDFLGFCIIWKRKRGTDKWYVYRFIADKQVQSLLRKIRTACLGRPYSDDYAAPPGGVRSSWTGSSCSTLPRYR